MKEGLNLHLIYAREMVDFELEKQINTHTAEWNTASQNKLVDKT